MARRNTKSRSGNLSNARPKKGRAKIRSKKETVDGIEFRSKLEAFCYRKLKEAGIPNEYENHKYTLVEGFHYPNSSYENSGKAGWADKQKNKVRAITYTPDFVCPNENWIIECKGFANDRFPLKWKMFKQLLMERDNPPVLFVPRNQKQCLEVVEVIKELIAPAD